MSEKRRLVITDDDLPADIPPASPTINGQAAIAAPLPSVAGVRPAPMQVGVAPGRVLKGTLATSIIGALVATLLGWVVSELVMNDGSESETTMALVLSSAVWVAALGAVFGIVYCAWEDAISGVWSRVPAAAGIGLGIGLLAGGISGGIAQALYSEMVESLLSGVDSFDELEDVYSSAEFYFARGIAWGLFGLGIGAAVGAAKRSSRKLINGLIGGVVGGALGGLFFHWVGMQTTSGAFGRLLGIAFVGLLIGAAIGLVEIARRQAWLRIVAGGMTGKEFIVYHQSTTVGSSPKCGITLIKDPAVGPDHFRIDEHGPRRALSVVDECAVTVNGAPVAQHWLRNGDVIQVGSTAIQYAERAVAA
jgi:MFS family permease